MHRSESAFITQTQTTASISTRWLVALVLTLAVSAQSAVAADWVYPLDIVSQGDELIIADRNWPGVWVSKEGQLTELFAASKRFKTPLNAVRCVAVGPNGEIYAGCSSTRQVYRLDEDGPKKLAGDGVGIGIPMDIAVAPTGELYVSDIELHRIFRLPAEGGEPEEIAAIRAPRGVLWDNDSLLVVSHGTNALVRVSAAGEVIPVVTGQPFNFAHEVARLGEMLYVTDGYADGVWPVANDGTVGDLLKADGFVNPVGITNRGETLLIVDPQASKLFELAAQADGAVIKETSLADLLATAAE